MAHGVYVSCDNPACDTHIPEYNVRDWLSMNTMKSQAEANELEMRAAADVREMMMHGATHADSVRFVQEQFAHSIVNVEVCSEECAISYLSDRLNKREFTKELDSGVSYADQSFGVEELPEPPNEDDFGAPV